MRLELKELFKKYNDEMFGGLLPEVPIELGDCDGCCGYLDPKDFPFIKIDPEYNESYKMLKGTLIHEMIHLWQLEYELNSVIDNDNEWHNGLFEQFADFAEIKYKLEVK